MEAIKRGNWCFINLIATALIKIRRIEIDKFCNSITAISIKLKGIRSIKRKFR